MLSPVSLRICWLAAMAPALTEAATQANSFTLPNSPATESFSPLSLHFPNGDKESKLSDISQSFATLSQIGARSSNYSSVKKKFPANCLSEKDLSQLPWTDINLNLKNHEPLIDNKLDNLCNRQNRSKEVQHTPCRLESIFSLHGLKNQCPNASSKQMMNEKPKRIQDTMGLLNANTSLDCELKGKLTDGSQPTEPDEKLLGLIPEDTLLQISNMNAKLLPLADSEQNSLDSENSSHNSSVRTTNTLSEASRLELEANMTQRNRHLRQKAMHLLARVRKLQARQLEWHIKGQLKAFVEYQQQNLGISCQHHRTRVSTNNMRIQNSEDLLHSEDAKNLSTAALVSLVRKLESSHHGKHPIYDFHEKEKVHVQMDPSECHAIKQTTKKLHSSLTYLGKEMDSDATESSSSDESGLDDDLNTALQNDSYTLPSHKQASWRWAVERAAVASRWIWLQTQVSDLEYKIRQQTDIYKHFRSHKGNLVFTEQSAAKPAGGAAEDRLSSTGDTNSKNSVPACFGTKVVNGFRPSETIGNGYGSGDPKGEDGRSDQECIRVRPLKMFRKRKLVRTMGLHLINRKMTKLSSVKCTCNCQRELLPCVICGGRYNSVQTLDPDTMTFAERISLLDSSFHPVLSLKNDACLGVRYEKILRKCEFSKSAEKQGLLFRKRRFAISLADQARRHTRKLTKNAAQTLLSSAKLRKTLGSRHHRFSRLNTKGGGDRYPGYSDSCLISVRRAAERSRTCSISSNGSSRPASPAPSPFPSLVGDAVEVQEQTPYRGHGVSNVGTLHELLRRRRFENAFDINNIVIPHSIASATRVEKLQYKEILTPKWRIFEDIDHNEVDEKKEEEVEDLCDDTYVVRHLKCEDDEKKKFRSYLTKAGHGRSRLRSSRLDNRADSSGANTPDPMSPYPADSSSNQEAPCGWNSPVASPPPTPNPFSLQEEFSTQGSPAVVNRERRRTLSLSKRVSEDEHQFFVEEYFAVPYEPRVFPLSDEDYVEMLKSSSHLGEAIQCEAANMACEDEAGLTISRPPSPGNSSSVGSTPEEDPNDPEWTVLSGSKNRKPSIILKLAKR